MRENRNVHTKEAESCLHGLHLVLSIKNISRRRGEQRLGVSG
jgi:hypothetical protein